MSPSPGRREVFERVSQTRAQRADFEARVEALTRTYAELSGSYQDGKAENEIPLR